MIEVTRPGTTTAPRVLHALAPGAVGGLESVVRALVAGRRRAGLPVAVACVLDRADAAEPLLAPLEAEGVTVERIVVPPRRYDREYRELAAAVQRWNPDLVHTHGYRADVVAGTAARRLGRPTVTTVHGFTGGGRKNRLYEWLQTRAFRKSDAVVAVSRPLVDRLAAAGVPRARIRLLPNAWVPAAPPLERAAARRALGLSTEGAVVGWVGRLSREKGADVLVRALPALGNLELTVSIVGDGRERAETLALAESLGVGRRIRWHGTVPDAGRLAAAFDCFVLSSRTEGTPIALFEAMAAGAPVVASAVGGVPDVVGPREALLVPPEDPEALAAAIRAVLEHPDEARTRARAATLRLESTFGAEGWLAGYEALYQDVLNPRKTR